MQARNRAVFALTSRGYSHTSTVLSYKMQLKRSPDMRRIVLSLASALACFALFSCQPQPNQPTTTENKGAATPENMKKAAAYDAEAVSGRIVTQVAGVKESEVVFINGAVRDLELLEDLNTDVRKVGAYPLLTISSDRMEKQYFAEVPEKYDTQAPELDLKLATLPAVAISIDSNEEEAALSSVPAARLANVGKTSQPVADLMMKRNVRQVAIGNDLYPTEWRAKRFGIGLDEFTKTFWEAVNADYS